MRGKASECGGAGLDPVYALRLGQFRTHLLIDRLQRHPYSIGCGFRSELLHCTVLDARGLRIVTREGAPRLMHGKLHSTTFVLGPALAIIPAGRRFDDFRTGTPPLVHVPILRLGNLRIHDFIDLGHLRLIDVVSKLLHRTVPHAWGLLIVASAGYAPRLVHGISWVLLF